ncbi:hypothetical protein M426DRAFT_317753 [Hypoxylon sp. CI-4A]|nr:hypothetical protein M426DRAFT_317753 [Hypoxylon sp. CI-4A]
MEALRNQLSETQGALTAKVLQMRQLRVDHAEAIKSWAQEKGRYEERMQQLEAEVQQLRRADGGFDGAQAPRPLGNGGNDEKNPVSIAIGSIQTKQEDDDEPIVITRSRMREVEAKYQSVTDELAKKSRQCEELEQQLQTGGSSNALKDADITDDRVKDLWENLRNKIRALTLNRFNETVQLKLVTEKAKREFERLSKHWKSYLSNPQLTSYFFRALIWRYVYTALFSRYLRAWGREQSDLAYKLADVFATPPTSKVTDADFDEWRLHTARMFHNGCPLDPTMMNTVTGRIFDTLTAFANGVDTNGLKNALSDIVKTATELTAIFARSKYIPLMSDRPGSELTYGFSYLEEMMEVKGKLGTKQVVDLMMTPCLLKQGTRDFSLVIKAEVIC